MWSRLTVAGGCLFPVTGRGPGDGLLWMRKRTPGEGEGLGLGRSEAAGPGAGGEGRRETGTLVRRKFPGLVGSTVWVPASGT